MRISYIVFLQIVMDSFKEFLESSTIHGLTYISSAPSKLSKLFWLLVVFVGFSLAFYLINSSYVDWQTSPIATSITTHPIYLYTYTFGNLGF